MAVIATRAHFTISHSHHADFWRTCLLFGTLYFLVMTAGALIVEPFSGGCMFIIPAYFMVLVVALPVLSLGRFGTGMAVFLPYAVFGFFPEYFLDRSLADRLLGALAWSAIGPLVGLVADMSFRFLPGSMPAHWRAAALGAITGAAFFVTTYLAMEFLYTSHPADSHYHFFTSGISFSLPWLVVNGAFAGYTAFRMTRGTSPDRASAGEARTPEPPGRAVKGLW